MYTYKSISCILQDPTTSQRQAALFNSTAVHASFGDIELAQITLRGAHLTTHWTMHIGSELSTFVHPTLDPFCQGNDNTFLQRVSTADLILRGL